MTSKLKTIDDLKPAKYNPRKISTEAATGLGESMARFGDLSGIVWNTRTGHLVAGHQRVAELRKRGAVLDGGTVVAGAERFPVRVVDWDDTTEQAANLAANNPAIAGEFTDDVGELLASVRDSDAELYEAVRLGELESAESHAGEIKTWDASEINLRALFVFRAPIETQPKIRELLKENFPGVEFDEEVIYG